MGMCAIWRWRSRSFKQRNESLPRSQEYLPNVARLILCGYSPTAADWKDLRPECVALMAEEKPDSPDARKAFGRYVEEEFGKIRGDGVQRSEEYWSSHGEAVAALVEDDLDGVCCFPRSSSTGFPV